MKKQIIRLIVFGGVALGLAALASANNVTEQSTISPALLQPTAATHETRTGLQEVIEVPNANDLIAEPYDFNDDGHSDYLLYNSGARQTAIWYLNNNVLIGSANGPV
ncbi:MAG: hypothetical protein WA849_09295, partial [Candidatus Udaeobacter sp.]